jgi:hypothetical protein
MARIKLVSNPYQKKIQFYIWSQKQNEWIEINAQNNPSSKLIRTKLVQGFFPFKVKEIIDLLLKEYQATDQPLEIVFEGTPDELKELQDLCQSEAYEGRIELSCSSRYLENARDILPEINEIYDQNLRPLILKSVTDYEKVRAQIDKYADASNDIVPICVLGNYSTGKSTFINALIGSEILPSGEEPITAKIYKISVSAYEDRASIQFKFQSGQIRLQFKDEKMELSADCSSKLVQSLQSAMQEMEEEKVPLNHKIHKALEIINAYDATGAQEKMADLIELKVPFAKGFGQESGGKIVIFDTPGSNSASNNQHLQVLKQALSGFSNGLPIFVSTFDSLDSTDNEDLYKEIENIEALDNRFTMIVVNKADTADLDKGGFSKQKQEQILMEAVPRNLYSSGLFFVSSVMGLGAKNQEDFMDDHYAELFDEKKRKFANPDNRFYKQLYLYNIMPEQLKERMINQAQKEEDLLYINSGIFSVEEVIGTFVKKYSSYNKCQQAHAFLEKVIQTTYKDVEKARKEREESRENRNKHLEKDKKELIEAIDASAKEAQRQFEQEYTSYMDNLEQDTDTCFDYPILRKLQDEVEKEKEEENDYSAIIQERNETVASFMEKTGKEISQSFKKANIRSALPKAAGAVAENVNKVGQSMKNVMETNKTIEVQTASEVYKRATKLWSEKMNSTQTLFANRSKEEWCQKSDRYKETLIQIVAGTSALDPVKKEEIEQFILRYRNLSFQDYQDQSLREQNFHSQIKIGHRVLYSNPSLNLRKMGRKYQEAMDSQLTQIRKTIYDDHTATFKRWQSRLISKVEAKIVDYSPQLYAQAQIIEEETAKIHELEEKRAQLAFYTQTIAQMMDWKES